MGRKGGRPWGETLAASGEIQWPPTGRFPWPPSEAWRRYLLHGICLGTLSVQEAVGSGKGAGIERGGQVSSSAIVSSMRDPEPNLVSTLRTCVKPTLR